MEVKAQDLEWRMYGLVPYNISDIQKGIQFGHAVVEYMRKNYPLETACEKWADVDKTFIILNGGTTNEGRNTEYIGTLNKAQSDLAVNGVRYEDFYEPDLGDQLTAVVFLVDERVWNKEKYPDFVSQNGLLNAAVQDPMYEYWVEKIGGDKNLFLRDFLSKFRLA